MSGLAKQVKNYLLQLKLQQGLSMKDEDIDYFCNRMSKQMMFAEDYALLIADVYQTGWNDHV